MDKLTITTNDAAATKIAALREQCAQHPGNANLFILLAELLTKQDHEIAAIFAAREAYRILSVEDPNQAAALLYQYGSEISAENVRPYISGNYLRLADHFGSISTSLRKVHLKKGEYLFREGDPADFIYLILEGELSVNTISHGHLKLLDFSPVGALVGEAALEHDQPRSASVIANEDSVVLRLAPQELSNLLKKSVRLSTNFAKETMLRRHVNLLSTSELFANLPLDLRFMVSRRTWNLSYESNTIIKKADEYMPHASLITSGTINLIEQKGSDTILHGQLVAGQMLGTRKLAGLRASPLIFETETKCTTVCMPFAVAEDIMNISPWFANEVTDTLCEL